MARNGVKNQPAMNAGEDDEDEDDEFVSFNEVSDDLWLANPQALPVQFTAGGMRLTKIAAVGKRENFTGPYYRDM